MKYPLTIAAIALAALMPPAEAAALRDGGDPLASARWSEMQKAFLAGAPVLEKGMVESDFAELAAAGVGLLGEIGLGSVKGGTEAATMVKWARAHGIRLFGCAWGTRDGGLSRHTGPEPGPAPAENTTASTPEISRPSCSAVARPSW